MFDEEDEAKRSHELITALRNDGYDVAYGADANEDFPEHVDVARDALEDPVLRHLKRRETDRRDPLEARDVDGGEDG